MRLTPVVLDTNILAPSLARGTIRHQIVNHFWHNRGLFLSEYILAETARVMDEDFGLGEHAVAFIAAMRGLATLVEPTTVSSGCRDISDLPVLGTAVAAKAAYLVTSDKDLLVLKEYRSIKIVKPGEYYRFLAGR